MTAIVCLDNNNGMLFNNRRQSRDKNLTADIVSAVKQKTLYTEPYSKGLFTDKACKVISCDDFLTLAGDGDFCFIEKRPPSEFINHAKALIIYRWNREYPYDMCFDADLGAAGFSLVSKYEFAGTSHEKITKEIYTR